MPEDLSLEDGLTAVAQRVVERLTHEAPPDRAKKLLTDALLLTGLRVRRDVAVSATGPNPAHGPRHKPEAPAREELLPRWRFGLVGFGPPALA